MATIANPVQRKSLLCEHVVERVPGSIYTAPATKLTMQDHRRKTSMSMKFANVEEIDALIKILRKERRNHTK